MLDKIKLLASDTAVYGLFTILGRFLNFMLTPLYTNYLTRQELGSVIYIFSIIAFINIIYSFGFETSFFRFFEKGRDERNKSVFTHSFLAIFSISALFSILLFSGAVYYAPIALDSDNTVTLFKLAAVIPFLDAIMLIPYARLRMLRKTWLFSITKFLLIVLAVAMNVVFVIFLDMGAEGVFYAQIIASGCGVLFFLPTIIKHLKFKFDKLLFNDMLRFGLPTLPANLAAIILQVADRPILEWLTGSASAVAMYGVNYRLGIPMLLFVTLFEYAWKPFYLSNYKEQNAKELFARVFTYFTMASGVIFLVTSFFMEYIVQLPSVGGRLINPDYWPGMDIVPVILAAYYFNGVFTNFVAGFLITKNTAKIPVAVGSAAAFNVLLNLILIPFIGFRGAAWATLGAYAASALVIYIFQRKIYPVPYEWRRVFILVIAVGAVYFVGTAVDAVNLLTEILIKISFLFIMLLILFLLKFFNLEELSLLKRMIKIK
ncbi:MAG: lipopolysaccharide biosynthesis protein [Candidatus Kapaibacterium sp.]